MTTLKLLVITLSFKLVSSNLRESGYDDTAEWRQNERDGVSNYRRLDCLLNCSFRRRSKNTPKLRVTGPCEGNSPVTSGFSSQRASDAESNSIWWRHHAPQCGDIYNQTERTHSSVTSFKLEQNVYEYVLADSYSNLNKNRQLFKSWKTWDAIKRHRITLVPGHIMTLKNTEPATCVLIHPGGLSCIRKFRAWLYPDWLTSPAIKYTYIITSSNSWVTHCMSNKEWL